MSKKLYVGNLPWSATDEDLQKVFEPFGAVVSATVIKDRDSGKSRGFGFVEMQEDAAATEATEKLDGSDLNGRPLKINEAKERTPRDRNQGGGGGYRNDRRDDHRNGGYNRY